MTETEANIIGVISLVLAVIGSIRYGHLADRSTGMRLFQAAIFYGIAFALLGFGYWIVKQILT